MLKIQITFQRYTRFILKYVIFNFMISCIKSHIVQASSIV